MADNHTEPMPIPDWMIVDAVRYATDRMTYQVDTTTKWLLTNWGRIPESARLIIRRDLERAFQDDDIAREMGRRGCLGWDCDRRSWERVRALWAEESVTEPAEDRGTPVYVWKMWSIRGEVVDFAPLQLPVVPTPRIRRLTLSVPVGWRLVSDKDHGVVLESTFGERLTAAAAAGRFGEYRGKSS